MTTTTAADRVREPRIIRRICYLIVGTIGLIAVIFGIATTDQVDAFTASAAVTSIVNYVSAYFTKKGADSSATDSELAAAQEELARHQQIADTTRTVEYTIRDAMSRIPGADQIGEAVLAALRAEELGEHAADPAAAPQVRQSVADYYRGQD